MNKFASLFHVRRFIVALLFGGLAAAATAIVYEQRDVFFHFDWARGAGNFRQEPDVVLEQAAVSHAEATQPGKTCVAKWVGKDDRYVYLALGCASFREKLGEIQAEGDQAYHATRFRYSGEMAGHPERPHASAQENGLRRLFPKPAADRLRSMSLSDYLRRGLERSAARGISP